MAKKRNKSYKPRTIKYPRVVLQQVDFDQIDTVLNMISTGEVNEHQGNVVMRSKEGEVYQVAPALEAWNDYWIKIAALHQHYLDDAPLRTLINKINCNIALDKKTIEQAKQVVEKQRQLFMKTDSKIMSKTAIKQMHEIAETA